MNDLKIPFDTVLPAPLQTDEEIQQKTEEIRSELLAHLGELVLLINRYEEPEGCFAMGHEPTAEDYQLTTYVFLGKIPQNWDGTSDFSTSNTLVLTSHHYCIVDQKSPTALSVGTVRTYRLTNGLRPLNRVKRFVQPMSEGLAFAELELFVGNQAVTRWFATRNQADRWTASLKVAAGQFGITDDLSEWIAAGTQERANKGKQLSDLEIAIFQGSGPSDECDALLPDLWRLRAEAYLLFDINWIWHPTNR